MMPSRVLLLVLIFCCFPQGHAQECSADGTCDTHERCTAWKEEGECYRNPHYMKEHCPVSCRNTPGPKRHECKDVHPSCPVWKSLGECDPKNNRDVPLYCPKTCGKCGDEDDEDDDNDDDSTADNDDDPSCTDEHENCSGWADMGECDKNPNYMHKKCAKSCNTCMKVEERKLTKLDNPEDQALVEKTVKYGDQQVVSGEKAGLTMDVVRQMLDYMENSDDFTGLSKEIQENCQNRHELCAFWAAIGECEANVAFMKVKCAPACKSCHLLDIETRCPKDPNAVPGLKPGDVNKMFERIVETAPGNRTLTDEEREELKAAGISEYSVVIHSRPSNKPSTEVSLKTDKELPPWVITFENFLTDEECDAMIEHGHKEGYKRSEDVGKQQFDGSVGSVKSKGRTSENAWCGIRSGCREEEVPKRLHERISNVTGIHPDNSEDFQILRYEIGQFYNTHHDFIPHQVDRQCGPRILTFFMYLSDVDAGGGTDFPDLGITVMPKKGRALLWPSVYNSEPMKADNRLRHQALPVEEGTKFAANGWLHMYDYQTPQKNGCN